MTATKHSIRYFGVTVIGERVPCTKGMKHSDWSWTATCSCGWDAGSGFAHKKIVELVAGHKSVAAAAAPVVVPADTTAADVAVAAEMNAQPAPVVHPLLEKCIQEVAELAAAPTTKTPFKLYANGGMTIFSRKDRAVTAGDALGVTYTVVNPKGKVVHSVVV